MRGLSAAVFAPAIAGARGWLAEGATLVAVGVETGHLRSALLQVNAAVRAPA
jgi:2-keto-3-deoxy-L-rhamnonate aldolase RhmA